MADETKGNGAAPPEPEPEKQTPLPVVLSTQRIGVPTPDVAENIRAALEAHETDAVVRDPKTKGWVYIRQRAMVNLEALKANEQAKHNDDDAVDDAGSGLLGPDGAPIEPSERN